jgi:hypothetical protein
MSADYAAAIIEWGTTPDTITLLELAKQILEITDTAQDTELSMFLQMAGEACERYCDNTLAMKDVREQFRSPRHPVGLRYYPTTTLNAVTIDNVDQTDDWTLYFGDGVDTVTLQPCGSDMDYCFKQMNVAYTAGYDPLPADLGYAIVRASFAYESAGVVSGQISKESVVGVGSVTYDTSTTTETSMGMLPAVVTGSLDPYKRYHV